MFLLLSPKQHWNMVKSGKNYSSLILRRFFIPGLLIILIFIPLGDFLFNSEYGYLWKDSLIKALLKVLLILFIFLASRILLFEVSKAFNIDISTAAVKRITIYSVMPAIFSGIVTGLLPFFYLGGVFPWYGLYLAYVGINAYCTISEEKRFYFFFVLFVGMFFSTMIFSFLLKRISFNLLY
jgi:hypothetical protein